MLARIVVKNCIEGVFGLQVPKVVSLFPKIIYSLKNHMEAAVRPYCVYVVKWQK